MSSVQQQVENLTGGNSSSSSLPIITNVSTPVSTPKVNVATPKDNIVKPKDNIVTPKVKSKSSFRTPVQDKVDPEDKPAAILSKLAYDHYQTDNTNETQNILDKYNIGYNVVENLSSPEYVTAINEQEKKVVVAYRGTDSSLTNIYDDIADVEIALGLAETPIVSYIPSRFRTAENIYKEVKEQYPDYDLTLTGHSLGGTAARYVGDRYKEKAVVFSAGATPLEPFIEMKLGTKPSSAKFYFTDTLDLISNTSRLTENNVRVVTTKEVNKKYLGGSHKVENYVEPIPETIKPINKPKLNYKQIKEKIEPVVNDINKIEPVVNVINKIEPVVNDINKMYPIVNVINKMYPQKKQSIITQFNNNPFNDNPFRRSICEERPELCYD